MVGNLEEESDVIHESTRLKCLETQQAESLIISESEMAGSMADASRKVALHAL